MRSGIVPNLQQLLQQQVIDKQTSKAWAASVKKSC
jgi:hypothetical protein